jgi:hypothetical protein
MDIAFPVCICQSRDMQSSVKDLCISYLTSEHNHNRALLIQTGIEYLDDS